MELWKNITFEDPWLLWLAVLPVVWFIYTLAKPAQSQRGMYISTGERLDGARWIAWLAWLPDLLRTLLLMLLVIAIARPQVALEEETTKGEGIDIMIAMDLSGSMLAQDFNPNRLEVSKTVAEAFVNQRIQDRIGLVAFSKEAITLSPLTTDYDIVKKYLKSLQVGMLNDGTAIGMGLATAVNRLKESEVASKIVILLTDGENNAGYIDPMTAAEIAQEYDVKVYTIGMGTSGRSLIPQSRSSGGIFNFGMGTTSIDEELLTAIAETTGGQYYRARDREELESIYDEIDRLEKTDIEINVFKRFNDKYRGFAMWSMILLGIEWFMRRFIFNPLDHV